VSVSLFPGLSQNGSGVKEAAAVEKSGKSKKSTGKHRGGKGKGKGKKHFRD
jgi:hypothetical protein